MVAVAGSAITTNVFLQMTATLMHLSKIQKSSSVQPEAEPVVAPRPQEGFGVQNIHSDLGNKIAIL